VRWPGNRLEEVRDSKAVDRESALRTAAFVKTA